MNQEITKEEFKKLINIKGKVRGTALKTEADFIIKEEGEEGLKKLEEAIGALGYPIKYKKVKTMDFYPIGLVALTLLGSKRIFGFSNEKFEEMGAFESKISLLIRIFMKYFVSIDRAAKEVANMWKKYNTVGELEAVEYDKNKRYIILRLKDFDFHPLHCLTLKGYFSSILKMIVSEEVVCEETKCVHRGDDYHEFLLQW